MGLFKKLTTRITYAEAVDALSEREHFAPLMVMPYLPGSEISVDCLKTAGGEILIPREKDYSRIERIRYDERILATCRLLLEKIPLECPCNIQFKYLDGVPYFLEVNTRMSGGVQMACAVSGVNLPQTALKKMLGMDTAWTNNGRTGKVAQILQPVVIG